jgi:cytochrome c-type biogenesis protein
MRAATGTAMFSLLLALLAGVVTIAAPCTLPVLPILLGASIGRATTLRPVFIALGFVVSFSAVALALGAVTEAFDIDPNVLRNVAALMLAGFGLLMVWPALTERLTMRLRGALPQIGPHRTNDASNFGGFLLGTALGLVWTPCAGPVLGAILTLVAVSKDLAWASLQLLAYAIGAALPMLAIAYGGQALTSRTRRLARYAPRLQQGFGVVVIAFAVVTYLHYDTIVIAWLTQFYPEGLTL